MEVELFTIRCSINQVTALSGILNIVVLIDSIHIARRIFDSSSHPFQIHAVLWQSLDTKSNNYTNK